jgi:hypothetical protein
LSYGFVALRIKSAVSTARTLRRPRTVLLLLSLLAVAAPAPAAAHLRSGAVATDYRASVRVPPRLRSTLTVQVYESDRALHLSVLAGHNVVVEGYLGEPLLRIDAAGVAVNVASPTAAGAGLLKKHEHVSVSSPDWRLRSGRRDVVWNDTRTRALPAGVARATWRVPLVVDGTRTRLSGEIWRVPRPSRLPWLGLTAAFLLATSLLLLARRRLPLRQTAVAFGLLAAAAEVVTAAGFALDRYASPGSWIAGGDEAVFTAVGVWFLVRGSRQAQGPAAAGLGLLGIFVGASKGAVFVHGDVLSVLPAGGARAAVALAIGTGIVALVCGGLLVAATPMTTPTSNRIINMRTQL